MEDDKINNELRPLKVLFYRPRPTAKYNNPFTSVAYGISNRLHQSLHAPLQCCLTQLAYFATVIKNVYEIGLFLKFFLVTNYQSKNLDIF